MRHKRTSDVLDDENGSSDHQELQSSPDYSVLIEHTDKRPRLDESADSRTISGDEREDELQSADEAALDDEELSEVQSNAYREDHAQVRRIIECAEAGVIESVSLQDFMCHKNLSIELGPNMNFIIGENGSGKSAILTAITVCLGGKAAISGRGSSLKTLVRSGQKQAIVTIKLKNRGPDAYKPDEYGNAIYIERRLNAEGGGSYILKNQSREKQSTRKDDLEAITDHFGLAIENPMNVLSQDTARQFLANATPKILYDCFMKGIELQQLETDHNLLSENIEATSHTLIARAKGLEQLKEQEAEAQKMYEETHRAREAQEELDLMKNQMAWIQVRDEERIRDEAEERLSREQENLVTLTTNLAESTESEREIREEMSNVQEKINLMTTAERDPIESRLEGAKRKQASITAGINIIQREIRECHDQIKSQDNTIAATQEAIEKERTALAENEAGVAKRRLEEQRDRLLTLKDQVAEETANIDLQYTDVQDQITSKESDSVAARSDKEASSRLVDSLNDRLDGLRRSSQNVLLAFDQNMERLVRAIDNHDRNGRWRQKPIGPLGRTMRLKYKEWSDIVENFWGRQINGFLVTDYEDKRLLLKLIEENRVRNCPVIHGSDKQFTPDEPDEKYSTVLRAIEWQDDRVRRQLIISNRPEGQLLIRNRQEAELTMDPMNPPRHAHRAFAIDPVDPTRGFAIGGGPRGASTQTALGPYRHAKRLTVNSEADLHKCQALLAEAQEAVRSHTECIRMLERTIRELEGKKNGFNNRRNELKNLAQRYSKELSKVRDDLDVTQAVDEGVLSGLQDTLVAAEEAKRITISQYQELQASKRKSTADLNDSKKIIDDINAEIETFEEKLQKLAPRYEALETDLKVLHGRKSHYERQFEERQKKVQDCESRLVTLQRRVEDYTGQASLLCQTRPEIEDRETPQRLERRLDDKQKAIKRIESQYQGMTVTDIAIRLQEAREKLAEASSEIDELQSLTTELRAALEVRQKSRKQFQKFICMRAKNNFVRHLGERDFLGKLSFDHKTRELHTHVTPADVKANMRGKDKKRSSDNKALSGGEKSFTTICLLLSIWEAMGCPIRALDEFDVFMDSVNRGISMRMMIDSANDSVDKQFIVITPLDMGGVKPTETTKIHRLKNPNRGVNAQLIASQA